MPESGTHSVPELPLPVAGCCDVPTVQLMPAATAQELAAAFKAIGHPIRLQIMHILAQAGGHVCVCEIEAQFTVKQPTVSHHLRTLREAGLVDAEQRGLYAYYRLRPDMLSFLKGQFERFSG